MPECPFHVTMAKDGMLSRERIKTALSLKPVVLLLPVRLGTEFFNPVYSTFLKVCTLLFSLLPYRVVLCYHKH